MPSPQLTINRKFMLAFADEDAPCVAPAFVVTQGSRCAMLGLRLSEPLPHSLSGGSFEFGYALRGTSSWEVVHLVFTFSGFLTFHALLNPSDPVVQAVLAIMVETGRYMVFVLEPDQSVLAFHAPMDGDSLASLKGHLARLRKSSTTEAQYRSALAQFEQDPQPPGVVLDWVCRGERNALEPQRDPFVVGKR